MKKLLLLFTVLLSAVGVWAQPQISDAPAAGQWAANTTWYRVETGNNYSLQIDKVTSEGYLALTYTQDSNSDIALWCVVGNDTDGYKFYNKAKGTSLVLGMTSSGDNASAVFVEDGADGYTTFFDFVQSEKTGNTYWCIKAHGTDNNYWNRKNSGDNRLKYWNSDQASKGDNGSAFLFTEVDLTTLEYATSDDITTAKNLISVAPGYPKTTTSQYITLNELTQCSGVVNSELTSAVNAYKTCSDILLPEDGKAYTFTALFKDGKKYKMNYQNDKKISVSDEVVASIFVCKELRAGVYAFITEDGKILTWVGNNEDQSYKEDGNIYGYSSYYAPTYNSVSDWNEITVKKNDTSAEQLGLLRLVARRDPTTEKEYYSAFIANKNKRFDQATDGNWFNSDNTSGWIVTEVEHTNTDEQNVAIAKIDVKETGYSFGTNVGEYYYMSNDVKVSDKETAFATLDGKTSVDEVNAFEGSFILNMPEAGKFYRIKNSASTPAYLISGTHANNVDFATDAATKSNSIFYYADAKLLSYENGMYLVKQLNRNFMGYAQAVGNSIDITFAACGTVGKYNIIFNTNRYFYSNGTGSNAGSSDGDQYYRFTLEEVTSLPVTVTAAKYATFYAPVAVQAEGVTANTVTVDGNIATLNEIEGGVIPANTGVILNGEAGTYNFAITTTANTIESGLKGTVEAAYVTEDAYVLANGDKGVGLYKAEKNQQEGISWLNNGFKAYLPATAVAADARFVSFSFGDTETAIESLEGENENAKAVVYDLAGRRVQGAQKGIFIVNGKKVIK